MSVVEVVRKSRDLEREDHLHAGKVESPSAPVMVHAPAVTEKRKRKKKGVRERGREGDGEGAEQGEREIGKKGQT